MLDTEHFQDVLAQFDVWSAIDIILIALVIFATLRVLSGTRGLTQLRGALALFLVFVVFGRLFDLTVVNFLVENSVTALVVGAVIILQPEIRRALDRLGRTGIQGWLTEGKHQEVIESVARAAGRMSAERHGGLFVLERETGLQDVIETESRSMRGCLPSSSRHLLPELAVARHGGCPARWARRSRGLRPPPGQRPRGPEPGTRHRAAIGSPSRPMR